MCKLIGNFKAWLLLVQYSEVCMSIMQCKVSPMGKIELTSSFSLLHHAHSFIFPFIHSFIHSFIYASVRHSFYNPYTLYFIHLVIHSPTRHLQALFVRRFFSCSCRLKPRWKVTPLTPDLSFVSSSRPLQKLLNLTPVHGVTPAATVMLSSPCAFIIPSCAEKFEPFCPSYDLLTLSTVLTDWLNFPFQSSCMSCFGTTS